MALSFDSLRCFVEAARLLNFRQAARAVALSPAALGQRISQLESDLGVRLFDRTTRSVVLTAEGLNLLPHAQRVLAATSDCQRAARGELGTSPTELVMGTRHELGMSWVTPMLSALEASHPGLTLHLYVGSGPDLVGRVRTRLIDCAITSSRVMDPKLDGMPLHDEHYALVGQPALLKRLPLRNAEDARAHTLLDATEDLPLFRYFRDAPGGIDSLAFARVVRLGTIDAIRDQALRGKGVAVLPVYFIDRDLRAGRLAKVMPRVRPLSDFFRLLHRVDDPRRSLFAALAEVMRAHPLR